MPIDRPGATVDAVYSEYKAAREWDQAVPALREAWENHEKKWTHPERTAPAPRPEAPGAWHGDAGRQIHAVFPECGGRPD